MNPKPETPNSLPKTLKPKGHWLWRLPSGEPVQFNLFGQVVTLTPDS